MPKHWRYGQGHKKARFSIELPAKEYDPFNDPNFDPMVDTWTAKQLRAVPFTYTLEVLDLGDLDYWWWCDQ